HHLVEIKRIKELTLPVFPSTHHAPLPQMSALKERNHGSRVVSIGVLQHNRRQSGHTPESAETTRMTKRDMRCGLFPFDARLLDDRPPFLDLGLLKGALRLRRLLLARDNPHSKIGEPCTHGRIGRAATAAALSLSITSRGVCLGAQNACQPDV